jgi:hypothetical protein
LRENAARERAHHQPSCSDSLPFAGVPGEHCERELRRIDFEACLFELKFRPSLVANSLGKRLRSFFEPVAATWRSRIPAFRARSVTLRTRRAAIRARNGVILRGRATHRSGRGTKPRGRAAGRRRRGSFRDRCAVGRADMGFFRRRKGSFRARNGAIRAFRASIRKKKRGCRRKQRSRRRRRSCRKLVPVRRGRIPARGMRNQASRAETDSVKGWGCDAGCDSLSQGEAANGTRLLCSLTGRRAKPMFPACFVVPLLEMPGHNYCRCEGEVSSCNPISADSLGSA